MSTEEKDELRPRKVIPAIRREQTDQEGERRPYNQGYERPEGNYERRPYNRPNQEGGYNRPYNDNRGSYGERPNRPRPYDGNNRGYGNSNYGQRDGGGYQQNRPTSYGNKRPQHGSGGYGNQNYGQYGHDQRPNYNRPRPPQQGYDSPIKPYSGMSSGDASGGLKKKRPRVGDNRTDMRQGSSSQYSPNRGGGSPRPYQPYGNNRPYQPGGGSGYPNKYGNRPQQRSGGRPTNQNFRSSFVPKQIKYKEVLADPTAPIRLNKFLSNAGVCSRREADEFIQAGIVTVNGQAITELGTKITRQDEVMFKDRIVHIESKVYIVLNKPKNTVTSSDDPQERKTVMELVKNACHERIYPIGRLDRNTTGVLLLTNDGDLASKLTHPAYKKKKIYHVWLDKNVAIEDMEKIANGIDLEDGEIHADAISYANEEDKSQVGIEIHSGRNRIVRRIFESLGYHVIKLDRVYFAGLTKKNLARGKWRYLNEREVNALRMGAFE
ncbi:MAG: RNA-binding S4 domain-containing protein [Tannerellaceae bacterium]|jgi:23S rRNA pseudouridine2605 synthase|nr:RNA-binding S4 domain-containing protein [Tannerellaceae bacterium]